MLTTCVFHNLCELYKNTQRACTLYISAKRIVLSSWKSTDFQSVLWRYRTPSTSVIKKNGQKVTNVQCLKDSSSLYLCIKLKIVFCKLVVVF